MGKRRRQQGRGNKPGKREPGGGGANTGVRPTGTRGKLLAGKLALAAGAIGAFLYLPTAFTDAVDSAPRVPSALSKIADWWLVDDEMSGEWTNHVESWHIMYGLEGPPGSPPPPPEPPDQGEVAMRLDVRGREIGGEITSRGIAEGVYAYAMLSGTKTLFGNTEIVVWDHVHGRYVEFARLAVEKADVAGEEALTFRTLSQSAALFPESFYVWRGEMPDAVYGQGMLKIIEHARQRPPDGNSSTTKEEGPGS